MADVSLDELIRKRGMVVAGTGMYSRLNNRAGTGSIRSRLQPPVASRPPVTSFQRTFDARQKIGITDARQKLGVKDAREKLAAKDARFRIKGKVQDAREMLNSRKHQVSAVAEKPAMVVDAREKLSLKRRAPAVAVSPVSASRSSTINLTKTIQFPRQTTMTSGLPHAVTGMRINVVNHQPPKQELFCVCGALKRARLLSPGVAEVVFVRKDDAVGAYKKYNNRYLDGQPMKCNLHLNGSVITSDQPILLRLSDTPSAAKKEGDLRRSNTGSSSATPNPPAEVDPDTILKALFKSSGSSAVVQPTAFKIKL
ncbi:hypothetical protein FKM82_027229 [Ascaphus truei]